MDGVEKLQSKEASGTPAQSILGQEAGREDYV